MGILGVAIGVPLALRVVIEAFMVLFMINESLTSANKQVRALRDDLSALARLKPPT